MNTFNIGDDVIDSRDIIARIEELESLLEDAQENGESVDDYQDEIDELEMLRELAEQGESSPDWIYGEALIEESYFTQYIEELIDDCYTMPEEFNSGNWPWRHMSIDFEAAAEEAKIDYFEIEVDGYTYLIRA